MRKLKITKMQWIFAATMLCTILPQTGSSTASEAWKAMGAPWPNWQQCDEARAYTLRCKPVKAKKCKEETKFSSRHGIGNSLMTGCVSNQRGHAYMRVELCDTRAYAVERGALLIL